MSIRKHALFIRIITKSNSVTKKKKERKATSKTHPVTVTSATRRKHDQDPSRGGVFPVGVPASRKTVREEMRMKTQT